MSARPRIWIDGQCFQSASRYRGIGRAILETLTNLRANHADLDLHLSLNAAHAEEAQTARNLLSPLLGADRIHVWEGLVDRPESQVGYGDAQRASEAVLGHHIRSLAPDLLWSPSIFEGGHNRYVALLDPKSIGVPSVVTFHDAIPWRFPDRYLADPVSHACYKRHLDALRDYDLALAVSPFAEAELRDILPDRPVTMVSSGLSRSFLEIVDRLTPQTSTRSDDTQLLYVGGLDWRKNVRAIILAMGILRERGRTGLRLRLVGDQPQGDVDALRDLARANGVDAALDFTGFCTDAELIRAYQECDIAVQPSIVEGFGLTALEALRAGAPLIAANAGALPFVVGDAALLFDPYDPGDLATQIERLIDDRALVSRLRQAGRVQSDRFDWEDTAARVAKSMTGLLRPTRNAPDPIRDQRARTQRHLPSIDPRIIRPDRLATHLAASELREPIEGGRILFDVTSTLYTNYGTGIQRVVIKIAQELLDRYPNSQLFICDSDVGMEAATLDRKGRLKTTRKLTRERIHPRVGDTIILLDSSWIWHRALETVMGDARLRGARVVTGMHDLVPVTFPAYCDDGMPIVFQKWLRAALRYSDAFMCVSKATADALHDLLSGADFPRPMKIGHFRLGADVTDRGPDGPHDPDHFIAVGTLEPRKGHGDIVAAFRKLWAAGEDVRLTFVGRPGWGTDRLQAELKALAASEPRFTWISDADDAQLARAYAEAGTLIAASHAEGFGLPLVEAGRLGCAVIARDITVFREVAPTGSQFFRTVEDLVDCVRTVRQQTQDAPANTVPFTWADSAKLLIDRIMADDFGQSYSPMDPDLFTPDTDTGVERMARALDPAEIRVRLTALPAKLDSPRPGHYRFAVRVDNICGDVLFSKGRLTGEDCVHLSYVTHDHDGHERDIETNRAKIPFALGRGQSTVLPIDIPDHIIDNPAILVHFAMVQEGRGWWPVLARLDRAAYGIGTEPL